MKFFILYLLTLSSCFASNISGWVQNEINGHKIVVFAKSMCGYSLAAKGLLKKKGLDFVAYDMDLMDTGVAIRDELRDVTEGHKTVPKIFVDGKFIGGFTELNAQIDNLVPRRRLESVESDESPTFSEETLDTMVEKFISANEVVMFSKSYCPHCKRTKQALSDANISFVVYELDLMVEGPEIKNEITDITGVRTVPQVFVGSKFFGDGSMTRKKIEEGYLDYLSEAASDL